MTIKEQLQEYAKMAQMKTVELDEYLMRKWFNKDSIEFWHSADFTNGRGEEFDPHLNQLLAELIEVNKCKQ